MVLGQLATGFEPWFLAGGVGFFFVGSCGLLGVTSEILWFKGLRRLLSRKSVGMMTQLIPWFWIFFGP
jgi:hypothetical protein